MYHILNVMILVLHYVACKKSLRIIGGRTSFKDEFPFVVRLEFVISVNDDDRTFDDFIHFCTGSALTPVCTLTAAHCAEITNFNNKEVKFYVRYGNFFPKDKGKISLMLKVEIHPKYYFAPGAKIMRNDIALIKTEPISVKKFAKVSALDYKTLYGVEVFTVGYGLTNVTENPKPLQVVKGMVHKCTTDNSVYVGFCLLMPCQHKTILLPGDSGGPTIHSSGIVGVSSMTDYYYVEKINEVIFGSINSPSGYIAALSTDLTWISNTVKSITK